MFFQSSKQLLAVGKNKYMIRSNFQFSSPAIFLYNYAMMMVDMQNILKAFCCVIESSTTGLIFFFADAQSTCRIISLCEQTRIYVWQLCLTSKHDFQFF